jgi:hypothetical protein
LGIGFWARAAGTPAVRAMRSEVEATDRTRMTRV